MPDASDFFQNLFKNLGGDKTYDTPAKIDPQTGEILEPGNSVEKHPFLSRMSGEHDKIEKLNQMMKLMQMQQNAKIGQSRLEHSQSEDTLNQGVNRRRLDETHQPVNDQTTAMIKAIQANPELLKAVQGATSARTGADTATANATESTAKLGKKQADAQLGGFDSSEFMNNLRAQMAKSLGITIGPGETYGKQNPDGTVTKEGQGSLPGGETQPTIDVNGKKYPFGSPVRGPGIPGNFNPNIKSLLDKAPISSGIGAGSVLDGSVTTQGMMPEIFHGGGFGAMPPAEPITSGRALSAATPRALGVQPSNIGGSLDGSALIKMLMQKIGKGAVTGMSNAYPSAALGQ